MKQRIFVIDDEKHIGSVLKAYLEDNGYEVNTAISIAEARESIKHPPFPDLILLDVMFRDGNGMIFLREIRRVPDLMSVPVIMMSAVRHQSQDRVAGFEFGADDYIAKPFDLKELHLRIERILRPRVQWAENGLPPEPEAPRTSLMMMDLDEENPVPRVFPTTPAELPPPSSTPPTVEFEAPALKKNWEEKPQTPTSSYFSKFSSLVLSPTKYFAEESEHSSPILGFLCMGLSSSFFGCQAGFEAKSFGMGFVSTVAFGAAFYGGTAALAWVIQWVMGLKRVPLKFLSIYRLLALGFGPLVISSVLGLIYVVGISGKMGEFTAGPLLIFPAQTSAQAMGELIRRIDVFELWSVGLGAFALSTLIKGRSKSIFIWGYSLWLASVVGFIAARGIFQ